MLENLEPVISNQLKLRITNKPTPNPSMKKIIPCFSYRKREE